MPKKTSTLRVQTRFSKPTATQIRRRYAVPKDERLQCEIRFVGQRGNAFLFTERTLYWTGESLCAEQLSIERIKSSEPGSVPIQEISGIRFENEATTAQSENSAAANTQTADSTAVPRRRAVQIETPNRVITIPADFLAEKDAAALIEILQKYVAHDAAVAADIATYKPAAVFEYARAAADWFRCGYQTARQYVHKIRSQAASFLNETRKEAQAAAETGKKKTVSFLTVLGHTIRHIFDLVADLVFAAAVIIAGKPNLADKLPEGIRIPQISIENLFRLDGIPLFWFCLLLSVFVIIKLTVLFSCSRGNKAVSILLLVLTVLSCLLIQTYFWLFILFFVLLYLSFQLSCGFSSAVIKLKVLLLILLAVSLYATTNIGLNGTVKDAVKILMVELKFPAVPKF